MIFFGGVIVFFLGLLPSTNAANAANSSPVRNTGTGTAVRTKAVPAASSVATPPRVSVQTTTRAIPQSTLRRPANSPAVGTPLDPSTNPSSPGNAVGTPGSTPNTTSTTTTTPQKLDINSLKQSYWRNNSAPDLKVVQNRIYTKAGRLNVQLLGGTIAHDPFLTSYNLEASIGYNISEYFGFHAIYWKGFESNSSAVTALQNAQIQAGTSIYGPNDNPIQSFYGAEVSWGFLYGKLSLVGAAILHFDFFLLGGAGALNTNNGTSISPWIGIAQQVYLTTFMAFRAEYRYMIYQENIIELNNIATKGNVLGSRLTSSPIVSLGLSFYIF